jgi:hypothetical protein
VKLCDLTLEGVPADAEIVHLNLTSTGSAIPLLLHANEVIRDPMGPKFHLYGRAHSHMNEGKTLSMSATWFVRQVDDTAVRHLVDAARHYVAKRYDSVVVPLNIAAESALAPVVGEALRTFSTREHVERFLRDAQYSHQLNVLLNVVAHLVRAPELPASIRSVLNRLRKLRNEIAHSGRCKPQSPEDAAEHLAAALFAVRYAQLLQGLLDTARR